MKTLVVIILLGVWSSIGHAEFKTKIGLSKSTNPLLLTSSSAISSTELEAQIQTESDIELSNSVLYYDLSLSGKVYDRQIVNSNAEQMKLSALVGLAKPILDESLLVHFSIQGQKILGRAVDTKGTSDGQAWTPSAYGSELSFARPVVGAELTWTPRLTLGYEIYQFEQDETDEFATISNSSHKVRLIKLTNELRVSSISRIQFSISQIFKDFSSRPSRFSDGRSSLSLPTESLRNDRIEIESQNDFDGLTLRLKAFQQNENDLRQKALDATAKGGLISLEFSDFFSLKPSIEISREDREFDNFRAGNSTLQDLSTLRKDQTLSSSFRVSKSFKALILEIGFKNSETKSNYTDLSIENQSVNVLLTKEF